MESTTPIARLERVPNGAGEVAGDEVDVGWLELCVLEGGANDATDAFGIAEGHGAAVALAAASYFFTPRDIHVPNERTQMVYGVTLALDNPERRLKPGMPADAWIRVADVPWPEQLPIPAD